MFRSALPLLAATVLAACAGGNGQPEAAPVATAAMTTAATTTTPQLSTTDVPATGSESGPIEVPAALQLTAPLVDGGEIELGELAGRPVLLWFWAPW